MVNGVVRGIEEDGWRQREGMMREYGVGHDLGGGDGDGWWLRGNSVVGIARHAEGVDGVVAPSRDEREKGGRVQGRRNEHFCPSKILFV
jgi:hypothetical protein